MSWALCCGSPDIAPDKDEEVVRQSPSEASRRLGESAEATLAEERQAAELVEGDGNQKLSSVLKLEATENDPSPCSTTATTAPSASSLDAAAIAVVPGPEVTKASVVTEDHPACCRHFGANNCGSPMALTPEDRKDMKMFHEAAANPSWAPIAHRSLFGGPPKTRKWMTSIPGSPLKMVKGCSRVPATAREIREIFVDPDNFEKIMRIVDVQFKNGSAKKSDAHHSVNYGLFRLPGLLPSRDFVWDGLTVMPDESTTLLLARSVPHPDYPDTEAKTGVIRGEIICSGYMAKDLPGGKECELTYIVQVDPKGWLPTWVVNFVAADQADNVTRIRQYFEKQRSSGA